MDLTIPDGTRLRPGESFSKSWRLVNSGSCNWTPEYSVVWFAGPTFSSIQNQNLNTIITPGQYIDITIDMVAPAHAGTYQSNWKLRAPDGVSFGLGPAGSAPFWVRIEVVDNRTPTPSPIPTLTSTPQKAPGGKVTLNLNDWIDLDASQNTSAKSDLMFILSDQQIPELSPENGALLTVFGENFPTLKDCLNANLNSAPLKLDGLKDGIYLCYQTDMGMPGFARLTKLDLKQYSLDIEYLTWFIPDLKLTPQKTKP